MEEDINPGLGGVSEEEWCKIISQVAQQESIDRLLFTVRTSGIDNLNNGDWSDVSDPEFQELLKDYRSSRADLEAKIEEIKHGS